MSGNAERDRQPDDVRRLKDEMDFHAVAGNYGWVVVAVDTGEPLNHTAYPEWRDAAMARYRRIDEQRWIILEIQPGGMPWNEAAAVLRYERALRARGYRTPPPDNAAGPLFSSMPYQAADRRTMGRQLISGRPLDPGGYENLHSETMTVPPAYRKVRK